MKERIRKVEIEENFLNPPNLLHSGETLEAFPLKHEKNISCFALYWLAQGAGK